MKRMASTMAMKRDLIIVAAKCTLRSISVLAAKPSSVAVLPVQWHQPTMATLAASL
jgi:hypothetical protein